MLGTLHTWMGRSELFQVTGMNKIRHAWDSTYLAGEGELSWVTIVKFSHTLHHVVMGGAWIQLCL